MPAVVTAAVPRRSPLVTNGFSGSFGIAFLLQVMPGAVERLLGDLAGDAERPEVDEHQVVVGAARHDAEALVGERRRRARARCATIAGGVRRGTSGCAASWKRDRLGRDHVHERAALQPGEHGLVDRGGVLARGTGSPRRAGRAASCAW